MNNKQRLTFLIVPFICFVILAVIIITIFHSLSGDALPVDSIAKEYICSNEQFIDEYGEVYSVSRRVTDDKIEGDSATVNFKVQSKSNLIINVCMEFEKTNDTWSVTNMEILSVSEID